MNERMNQQAPTTTEMMEMMIAPVADAAHHRRVCDNLDYARRVGDGTAILLLMAQLSHSRSWRPAPSAEEVMLDRLERAQEEGS